MKHQHISVEVDPLRAPPGSLSPVSWITVRLNYVDAVRNDIVLRSGPVYIPESLNPEVLERVINDALRASDVPDDCELEDELPHA